MYWSTPQWVPHVEQELLTLPEHLRSPPVLVGFELLDLSSFVQYFICPLPIFIWQLHCMIFFNLRLPITPLVSSNIFLLMLILKSENVSL